LKPLLYRSVPAWAWLALFLLPGAGPALTALGVLARSGELASLPQVVGRQAPDAPLALYGAAYSDFTAALKLATWQQRRPQVLAYGNSRVMQFRAGFFPPRTSFYNAGGLVGDLPDYRGRLASIPLADQPDILLVGIEHFYFIQEDRAFVPELPAGSAAVDLWERHWRTVLHDYEDGKYGLGQVLLARASRIGLQAVVHSNGFRNDGSYRYGRILQEAVVAGADSAGRFRGSLEEIRRGTGRYIHRSEVRPAALKEFAALLETCRKRRLHVVAFLPPFADATYAAMQQQGERYAYLRALAPALQTTFAATDFTFADFTDPAILGGGVAEFLDDCHGSEKTYLRLLLALARKDRRLHAALDIPHLEQLLSQCPGDLQVFPEPL